MIHRVRRSLLGLLLVLPLMGCATYTSALDPGEKLSSKASYIYGRFRVDPQTQLLVGHVRVGVTIEVQLDANASEYAKDHAEDYAMEFDLKGAPKAIAVRPGTYALRKVTVAAWDHESLGKTKLPEGTLTQSFNVEPGKAYYLGDMEAETSKSFKYPYAVIAWRVQPITDNYAATTAELKSLFPEFESIPTERVPILEAPPAHPVDASTAQPVIPASAP